MKKKKQNKKKKNKKVDYSPVLKRNQNLKKLKKNIIKTKENQKILEKDTVFQLKLFHLMQQMIIEESKHQQHQLNLLPNHNQQNQRKQVIKDS